ncbi:MAG TPA: mercury resistance system periplasmic binding protein MerP [Burkholderiales bacterium]|nr:mercury resistance system periplasmic binding protein MerP [Burkholderiales bacterium]
MKKLITVLSATALLVLTGAAAAANKTVTLAVENMTCAVCPITVKKALNSVAGVSKTEVSYERKEAVVTYDDAKTDVESLIKATTNAGYPASVKAK